MLLATEPVYSFNIAVRKPRIYVTPNVSYQHHRRQIPENKRIRTLNQKHMSLI